jgi:hypothetical protein
MPAGLLADVLLCCCLPACLPACSDMLLAQQKVDETKAALAIAYQTSTHIEDKGPQVQPRAGCHCSSVHAALTPALADHF